jgi:hypothetical protein
MQTGYDASVRSLAIRRVASSATPPGHDASGGETLAAPGDVRPPLLLLLLAAGCFGNGIPVAETDVTLAAVAMFHVNASEQSIAIVFGDQETVVQHAPCPVMDANLSARLNGIPVPLITRGAKTGDEPGDDVSDNNCATPLLKLDLPPPDGPSLLEISDPATTLSCTLPDLKAVRQATPVLPASWQWRAGQAVTLQWSPSGDLQVWNSFSIGLANQETFLSTGIHDLTQDGDLLHFTVPSLSPGSYRVELFPSEHVDCGPKRTMAVIASRVTRFVIDDPVVIAP